MKKEVIIVPKDKCPLDALAEMKEQTYGVGILFSVIALNNLMSTVDRCEELDDSAYLLSWNATEKFPKTTIVVVSEPSEIPHVTQYRAVFINADDICFRSQWDDRTVDYFLTMEEWFVYKTEPNVNLHWLCFFIWNLIV